MSTRTPAQVTTRLPALPIDRYRGIAAVLLIGMLLVAAFAPQAGTTAAAPPPPLPPFDGQPAPTLADSIFDYPAAAERELILPAPKSAVLRAAPGSADALSAIGGAMIIEDTDPEGAKQSNGSPHPASESVQPGGPSRWDSMEQYFVTIRDAWSANGLAVVETLRAASSEGHDQEVHLRKALFWVDIAVQQGRVQAPYMYNQALLHLALGHYQQAAASMDEVITNPSLAPASGSTFDMAGAQFYKGVALLRLGNPADALTIWRTADAGTPTDWSPAIREGIADALAAQGDVTGALTAYQDIQDGSGGVEWGLYEKQLRLTFLQGGAPQALALVRHLVDRVPAEPRLQYDLGRLLLMQGQPGGAASAFRAALQSAPDDPAYHTGLAQALLAGG